MAKRILVIDDDKDILSIMDFIFADQGHQTILYDTGTTAEDVELLNPDLILLDVRITGFHKTGDEICAEIKANPDLRKIPILLVSAETDLNALAGGCGADGYVSKPFEVNNLLAIVKEFLH